MGNTLAHPVSAATDWPATWLSILLAADVLVAYLAIGLAWMAIRPALPRLARGLRAAPGRLRYLCRLAWYRATRRMPRGQRAPAIERVRLTGGELGEFVALMRLYRQRGVTAREPGHTGRRR